MDADRFDLLAKTLTNAETRRDLLTRLGALPLGATLAALLHAESEAGRRKRRKARRRHRQNRRQDHRQGKHKGTKKNKDKKDHLCESGLSCNDGCPNNFNCIDNCCVECDVCEHGCSHATIQEAIDNAGPAGIVVVCPGAYRERLTIDEDLVLSGGGSFDGRTLIDGTGGGRVVTISGSPRVTLQWLHLTGGGQVEHGGGLSLEGQGVVTVQECAVTNSHATFAGGGIANAGTMTLDRCLVDGNTSVLFGGGVHNLDDLTATGCALTNNRSADGAGLHSAENSHLALVQTTVDNNQASGLGGGIFNNNGTVTLDQSTLAENTANDGGGITNWGSLTMTTSTITKNVAHRTGGGISTLEGTVTIEGASVITSNTVEAQNSGGGIYNQGSAVSLSAATRVEANIPDNCAGDAIDGCSN